MLHGFECPFIQRQFNHSLDQDNKIQMHYCPSTVWIANYNVQLQQIAHLTPALVNMIVEDIEAVKFGFYLNAYSTKPHPWSASTPRMTSGAILQHSDPILQSKIQS